MIYYYPVRPRCLLMLLVCLVPAQPPIYPPRLWGDWFCWPPLSSTCPRGYLRDLHSVPLGLSDLVGLPMLTLPTGPLGRLTTASATCPRGHQPVTHPPLTCLQSPLDAYTLHSYVSRLVRNPAPSLGTGRPAPCTCYSMAN